MEKAEKDEIFDLATAQDNKLIDSVAWIPRRSKFFNWRLRVSERKKAETEK